jgi:hypothetical protein
MGDLSFDMTDVFGSTGWTHLPGDLDLSLVIRYNDIYSVTYAYSSTTIRPRADGGSGGI